MKQNPRQRPPQPAAESKQRLRRQLERELAAISTGDARRQARAVREATRELAAVANARRLLCCLSFGCEIDTWQLVADLLTAGCELYVPRVEPADHTLTLHRYPCALETLSFGLQQPTANVPALAATAVDSTIDAALLLGLAYDPRGYRLGYGGGYFDRFLAGKSFPAIGLAYEQQIVPRLPVEEHDVPLNAIVTGRKTLWPRR